MRVLLCTMMTACVCLTMPGCALFKKSDRPAAAADGGGAAPAKFPGSNDPILNSSGKAQTAVPATAPNGGAVLAGSVKDGQRQPPPNTFIRLVSMDQKDAQPIEVAVDPQGCFTVLNLKPGGQYKLLARGKNGERMVAGVTYTAAPNVRVFIQMKEEFAHGEIPDLPASPAYQGERKQGDAGKTSSMGQGPAALVGGSRQHPAHDPRPSGEAELPSVNVPMPTSANPPAWNPGSGGQQDLPPILSIPPQKRAQPTLQIPDTKPAPPPQKEPFRAAPFPPDPLLESAGQARVPSCVLVGKQLVNFALLDAHGEPWEFRSSRKGKLVLLDFWRTDCMPCLQSIPDLRTLHHKHGRNGLEIIGVANETGGSYQEQAMRVQSVCQRQQVPYKQLIAGGVQCPLRTQLGVQGLPTLVLLDANGWILWTHVGRTDSTSLAELDRLIQRRLSK